MQVIDNSSMGFNKNTEGTLSSTCKIGTHSLYLNNKNIVVGDIGSFSQMTIMFWCKIPTTSSQRFLFGSHNSWTGNGVAMWHDANSNIVSTICKSDAESTFYQLPAIDGIIDNTWHHLAFTYNGTQVKLYKDSILQSTTTYGKNGKIANPNLVVGGGQGYNNEVGLIDEFKIYGTALSSNDIQKEYKNRAIITDKNQLLVSCIDENRYNKFTSNTNGIITGTTETAEVFLYPKPNLPLTTNHIYYSSIWGYQDTRIDSSVQFFWPETGEGHRGVINLGPAKQWNLYSWRFQGSTGGNTAGTYNSRFDFNNNFNASSINFKNASLVDLTEIFGSGNEPSKDECDKIFNNISINEKGELTTSCIIENEYYLTNDGAKFLKIFSHDIRNNTTMFPTLSSDTSDVKFLVNGLNRFSRLEDIPLFKASNGKYEFLLRYPNLSTTAYNRWRQTANPLTTQANASQTAASMGYEAVEISWTGAFQYGLGLSTSSDAYLDCQAGLGTWFGAIGQNTLWQGGFPAADRSAQKWVELYIRIDNIENYKAISFRNNKAIFVDEFIED